MFRTRIPLAVAALVVMAHLSSGQQPAQPNPFRVATAPLLSLLLPYVGDETFGKELNLSAEQSKRLVAFRQKVWDETYTTAPKDLKTDERNKAIEAEVKSVLEAAQLKRATQLATRFAIRDGGLGAGGGGRGRGGFQTNSGDATPRTISAYTLARFPELAAALKLDATQKKVVELSGASGGGLRGSDDLYLVPTQSATLVAMMGDAPKGVMRTSFDTRTNTRLGGVAGGLGGGGGLIGGPFGRGLPLPAGYLLGADVQKHLEMTEAQVKTLAELRAKLPATPTFDPAVSPAEQQKTNAKAADEFNTAVEKLLTAEQKKRFEQMQRQRRFDTEYDEGSELGKLIGVTAEQRKAYAASDDARAAAVVKAVGSGDPLEKVSAAVEMADKAYEEAVAKILTADQRAKRDELLGKPFTGRWTITGLTGPAGQSPVVAMRRATFGKHYADLSYLALYTGVQAELKMTEDQIKRITEAQRAILEQHPTTAIRDALGAPEKADKLMSERSAAIQKVIGDILSKEQQARFRELMIQLAEAQPAGPGGVVGTILGTANTGAGVPGVAEAIKLTDEQRKQFRDGTSAARVLTDDQKAEIKRLAGKPVTVAEVFSRPGFPGGAPTRDALPPSVTLARSTGYWDIVKLSPEQVGKLAAAFNEYNLAFAAARPTPEQQKAAGEAVTMAVESVLSADVRKRFEQLAIQSSAASSLVNALLGTARTPSRTKTELAITEEQDKAIRAASAEVASLASLLDRADTGAPAAKAVAEARAKLRDRLDEKVMSVLTADQKAKWKAMTGEPHPGFTKQPLFGGGFGPGGGLGAGGGGFGLPPGP